jgi:hypothetical protein
MSFSFIYSGRVVNFHTEVGGNETTRPVFEEQPAKQEEAPEAKGETE